MAKHLVSGRTWMVFLTQSQTLEHTVHPAQGGGQKNGGEGGGEGQGGREEDREKRYRGT